MVMTINRSAIQQSLIADTYGWDTVYAVKYSDVNAAIAKAGVSQTLPQVDVTSGNESITINTGDFGDWALTTGGDAKMVRMDVPITAIRYQDTGASVDKVCDNLLAKIVVCLEFIPQRDNTLYDAGDDAEWMELRIAHAPLGDNSGGAAVSVTDIEDTAGTTNPPTSDERDFIQQALAQWLNVPDNLKEFNHVFAAVNLNDKAGVDEYTESEDEEHKANDFRWLKPKRLGYAVADGPTLADSVFAVLATTERDEGEPEPDPEDLFHRVSANAIPEGQRSAFLLSKERYLKKMLLPGAGKFFTGPVAAVDGKSWPQDYFELEGSGTSIRNTDDVYIRELEVHTGKQRAEVKAGNFAVHLRDDCLEVEFVDMHHPFSGFLSWVDTFHTIRSQAVPRLRVVDAEDKDKKTFKKTLFDLEPSTASNAVHSHDVIAVKSAATQWVQIGLLGTTLLFTIVGLARAYQLFKAGDAAIKVSGATMNAANTARAASALPLPAGQTAEAAAAGANAALTAMTGAIEARWAVTAIWQIYRTTALATIGTVLGIAGGTISLLEAIANRDAQNMLPDFKEFTSRVMSPVRWPTEESEFTPADVCFNGSFQISGNPDFADNT